MQNEVLKTTTLYKEMTCLEVWAVLLFFAILLDAYNAS